MSSDVVSPELFCAVLAMCLSVLHHVMAFYFTSSCHRESLMSSGECRIPHSTLELIKSDIRRTDRTHPFYQGDDNPNLLRLE